MKKPMPRILKEIIAFLVTLLVGLSFYYVSLPAINLKNPGFYAFACLLCGLWFVARIPIFLSSSGGNRRIAKSLYTTFPLLIIAAIVVIGIGGGILSAQFLRSGSYQSLLKVETGSFVQDVEEITFNQIPLLDKDSAAKLGDRKLGELADVVSQFEVADDYVQINYKNHPVRVTPLVYGDFFKWLGNRSEGIPAYIRIDMVTQNVEVVRLAEGMKYSPSERFGRNLARTLRFQYPTYLFDTPVFETDENGTPYWVCARLDYTIGLFGGKDVRGAVLLNAISGEATYYDVKDVPEWVDRVYSAELILEQYDYYGKYKNGFFNTLFGQKGMTMTTAGYNYLALGNDIYVYTGITSVGKDESNIGFILSNQRTKQTKFYAIPGAEEYSAMSSAQGVVQHLGYQATFPLLINIGGQPTYFLSLKDNAGLVKMYAMVNVGSYQLVGTGTTVSECEKKYRELLGAGGTTPTTGEAKTVTGVVQEIRTAVIEGTSYYYIRLTGGSAYYAVSAASNESVVILNAGDKVEITYLPSASGILQATTISKK